MFEELLHVKALSHLSTMVKKELARVVRFEQHQHAGTVLFHQGDEGKSWFIILRGSVDVSIVGKVSTGAEAHSALHCLAGRKRSSISHSSGRANVDIRGRCQLLAGSVSL